MKCVTKKDECRFISCANCVPHCLFGNDYPKGCKRFESQKEYMKYLAVMWYGKGKK